MSDADRMLASSLAAFCACARQSHGDVAETPSAIGTRLAEITLSDAYGQQHAALDQDKHQ